MSDNFINYFEFESADTTEIEHLDQMRGNESDRYEDVVLSNDNYTSTDSIYEEEFKNIVLVKKYRLYKTRE